MPGLGLPCGLSTGWDPVSRRDFPSAVAAAAQFSAGAVELSALSARDLPALEAYLASPGAGALGQFGRVSVHGPAKHLDDGWPALAGRLAALPGIVSGVVLHPDTVPNLADLAPLGSRATLENMDCRKDGFRTAAELAGAFEALPDARFCLDVAHAWTVDPSLQAAHALLDAYAGRLAQVHLSGITAAGVHRPATPADLRLHRPLLDRLPAGTPVIFEAPYLPQPHRRPAAGGQWHDQPGGASPAGGAP